MDDAGLIFRLDDGIKLFLAVALGFLIGLERELHGRPAGVRTHILVALGATLLIIGSRTLPAIISDTGFDGRYVIDPARLAAGIITGIGFLGAGVVIKTQEFVRGVTTAATIWFSACIGILLGMGFYLVAVIATVMEVVLVVFLARVSGSIYRHTYHQIKISGRIENSQKFMDECRSEIERLDAFVLSTDYGRNNRTGELTVGYYIRSRGVDIGASLIHKLGSIPGVLEARIE